MCNTSFSLLKSNIITRLIVKLVFALQKHFVCSHGGGLLSSSRKDDAGDNVAELLFVLGVVDLDVIRHDDGVAVDLPLKGAHDGELEAEDALAQTRSKATSSLGKRVRWLDEQEE